MPKKIEKEIKDKLKKVIDPEIGLSIIDLGFIYGIDVENGKAHIKMTLTTPGCPMFHYFESEIAERLMELEEISDVKVEFVFDPPWTKEMVSKEIREKFGF